MAERELPMTHSLGTGPGQVIAVHGITANGLSFAALSQALEGVASVLAPDLAGRACSAGLPDPEGLRTHAGDVIRLLEGARDESGRPAVLLGHSMGAFVSAIAAATRPDLVAALVLVDGGLAFPMPEGASPADVDAAITAVIGPAMRRLSMRFASDEDYLQFWAEHPAVGPLSREDSAPGQALRDYLLHDLVRDDVAPAGESAYRSSCDIDAIRIDGAMTFTDAATHSAPFTAVDAGVPVRLLWAPRGLADEPQGLYDEGRLAALNLPEPLVAEQIPDVNHYTILFDPPAVTRVAEIVRETAGWD